MNDDALPVGAVIIVKTNRSFCGLERGILTGHSNGNHDGLVYYYTDVFGNPKWCFAAQVYKTSDAS